jgi:hypothetical protein
MATTTTDTHQSCHDNWQLATATTIDPPYPGKWHSSSFLPSPLAGSVDPCALNGIYRHQISHQGRLRLTMVAKGTWGKHATNNITGTW